MRFQDRVLQEQARSSFLLQLFPWRKKVLEAYSEDFRLADDETQTQSVLPATLFWEWLVKLAPTAKIPEEHKQHLEALYCSSDVETGIDMEKLVKDFERYEREPGIDPEMQFDVLPQPYRMIVKVLEEDILEVAWDKIVQRMPRASSDSKNASTTLLPRISVGRRMSLLPDGEVITSSCSVFGEEAMLLCTNTYSLYLSDLKGHEQLVQFEQAPVDLVAKEYIDQEVQLVALCFRKIEEDPSSSVFVLKFFELRLAHTGGVSGATLTLLASVEASDIQDLSPLLLSDVFGDFAVCLRTDETRVVCTYNLDFLQRGTEIELSECQLRSVKEYTLRNAADANTQAFLHYLDGSTLVCGETGSLAISVICLTSASHIEQEFNTPFRITCLQTCRDGFVAVGMEDGSFFLYNCHTNYVRSFVRKCDTPVEEIFSAEPFLICAHESGDMFVFDTSESSTLTDTEFDPKSDIGFVGKLDAQEPRGKLQTIVRVAESPLAALALTDEHKGVRTCRVELVDLESASRLSFLYHSKDSKDGEVLRPDDPIEDEGWWMSKTIVTHLFNDIIVVGNGELLRRFELSNVLSTAVKPLHSAYLLEKLEKYPFLSLVAYFYAHSPAHERYGQETCIKMAKNYAQKKQQEMSAGRLSPGSRSVSRKSGSTLVRSRASTSLSQSIGTKSRSRLTSLASSAKLRVAQSLEGAIAIDWPSHLEDFKIEKVVDAFEVSREKTKTKRERYLAWRLKELQANPAC